MRTKIEPRGAQKFSSKALLPAPARTDKTSKQTRRSTARYSVSLCIIGAIGRIPATIVESKGPAGGHKHLYATFCNCCTNFSSSRPRVLDLGPAAELAHIVLEIVGKEQRAGGWPAPALRKKTFNGNAGQHSPAKNHRDYCPGEFHALRGSSNAFGFSSNTARSHLNKQRR